jgi:GTPase SAR1 family protein
MSVASPLVRRETLLFAAYYAPRGRLRLYKVASELAQRYLNPADLLIGVIGLEGAGKSTLIKGLFPGLELTNDDEGINVRPTPLLHFNPEDPFSGHTFHVDVRYELAFRQVYQIVDAINNAITHSRRVVVEHFDLIYAALGYNAQVLFAIGEEIIVARPTVFGPFPEKIKAIVDKTIEYRLMAHSAEDITTHVLEQDYGYTRPIPHSDVRHGFVINFPEKPALDLHELEQKVKSIIAQDVPIHPSGEDRIRVGDWEIRCTGIRTHAKSSGRIENFRLRKEFMYDPISKEYLLVGRVGKKQVIGFDEMTEVPELREGETNE